MLLLKGSLFCSCGYVIFVIQIMEGEVGWLEEERRWAGPYALFKIPS